MERLLLRSGSGLYSSGSSGGGISGSLGSSFSSGGGGSLFCHTDAIRTLHSGEAISSGLFFGFDLRLGGSAGYHEGGHAGKDEELFHWVVW